jgi:predicted transcriptional regulator
VALHINIPLLKGKRSKEQNPLSKLEISSVLETTVDIVAAYVGNNDVAAADVPGLIRTVHLALTSASVGETTAASVEAKAPPVSIKRSVQPDFIVCLEDGVKLKSLKRHLRTKFDLSPQDYRAKWGLPENYPMTAPNYAAARSAIAKKIGLGQFGRKSKTTAKS